MSNCSCRGCRDSRAFVAKHGSLAVRRYVANGGSLESAMAWGAETRHLGRELARLGQLEMELAPVTEDDARASLLEFDASDGSSVPAQSDVGERAALLEFE